MLLTQVIIFSELILKLQFHKKSIYYPFFIYLIYFQELDLQFFKNNITEKIGDYNYLPEWETSERLAYVYFKTLAEFYNFQ